MRRTIQAALVLLAACGGPARSGPLVEEPRPSAVSSPAAEGAPTGASVEAAIVDDRIIELARHGGETCARRASGAVWCWGVMPSTADRARIEASLGARLSPPGPTRVAEGAVSVAVGWLVRASGGVARWSYDLTATGGEDSALTVEARAIVHDEPMPDGGSAWSAGAAGCVVTSLRTVRCFTGSRVPNPVAEPSGAGRWVEVVGLSGVSRVSARWDVACALAGERVWCWGMAPSTGLGRAAGPMVEPAELSTLGAATSVSVGEAQACAVLRDGGVACWGDVFPGEGDGTDRHHAAAPEPVAGLSDVVEFAPAAFHACARLGSGEVRCATERSPSPWVPLRGVRDARALVADDRGGCVLSARGALACWSWPAEGAAMAPVPVVLP